MAKFRPTTPFHETGGLRIDKFLVFNEDYRFSESEEISFYWTAILSQPSHGPYDISELQVSLLGGKERYMITVQYSVCAAPDKYLLERIFFGSCIIYRLLTDFQETWLQNL